VKRYDDEEEPFPLNGREKFSLVSMKDIQAQEEDMPTQLGGDTPLYSFASGACLN